MNGLFLHTGNRLELLVEQLAAIVAQPGPTPRSPLQPETILVQSLGMQRWISLQLAEKLGICMNVEFPFPRSFIDETIRSLIPQAAAPESFAPELLAWKIHRLLPGFLQEPAFAPVARFLSDADSLKLFQLSQRLARLFDQYLAYRPEMICEWEAAATEPGLRSREQGDAAWQAPLWRALNAGQHLHFASLLHKLPDAIKAIEATEAAAPDTVAPSPPRLSIFGITSLPPSQMQVLLHLAANRPVHLFLLAPSKEYHGDDLTPKQRARLQLPDAPAGEGGNPLLTSLGRLHAHFTEVILEIDERVGHRTAAHKEHFAEPLSPPEEPTSRTLLHRLQSDILHARPPTPLPFQPGDRSIQLHSCHSPMREIEVLYDHLLSFLDAPDANADTTAAPRLLPRDILVMAPDIEQYAPFIHAVFGNPESPNLRIPYSIADRQARSESHTVDTFLRLLDLPDGRFTAPEVATLLNSPPFRATFGFSDADTEQLHDWLLQSGIRWGVDAAHREAMALPPYGENSWRSGLDRLLLGYAMIGRGTANFANILPLDDVESGNPDLLGRLLTACEHLIQATATLKEERSLGEWPPVLHALIERFFANGTSLDADEHDAIAHLRQTIEQLETIAAEAGPEQPAPFPVIREHLAFALNDTTTRGRFLTGGVTFCALKPMRSIPARVIWLLGMDDGVFPRRGEPLQFDLMSKKRRLGDRSPREDDRALFLEAIISARDTLCISTIGRSIRNNEAIPPSIVVSEFLDYLDTAIAFPAGTTARQQLLVEHRLHPFSPIYFQNHTQYPSYSASNAAVANATRSQSSPAQSPDTLAAFPFNTPLPPPEESYLNVTLQQLLSFFATPCGTFLKERYGIQLRQRDESLEESEPLTLNSLQAYSIRAHLSEALLSGSPLPTPASLAAQCALPPGSLGEQHYRQLLYAAERFSSIVRQARSDCGPPAPPVTFSLSVEPMTFSGVLTTIHGTTCLQHRPSKFGPKDRLNAWLHHLAWNAAREAESLPDSPTLFISETERTHFLPPSEESATTLLADLLALYWEGLTRPLPLFPSASYAYARHLHNNPGEEHEAQRAAAKAWASNDYHRGDDQLAGAPLCFPPECGLPFDTEFGALALRLFSPLLAVEQAEPL